MTLSPRERRSIAFAGVSVLLSAIYWFANDSFITAGRPGIAQAWRPQKPGRYVVRVVDEQGRADTREVVVAAAP